MISHSLLPAFESRISFSFVVTGLHIRLVIFVCRIVTQVLAPSAPGAASGRTSLVVG